MSYMLKIHMPHKIRLQRLLLILTISYVVFFCGCAQTISNSEQEKNNDNNIEKLIKQLGADEWQQRDSAQEQLAALGDQAFPYLKQAINNPDLEIAHRARDIITEYKIKSLRLIASTDKDTYNPDENIIINCELLNPGKEQVFLFKEKIMVKGQGEFSVLFEGVDISYYIYYPDNTMYGSGGSGAGGGHPTPVTEPMFFILNAGEKKNIWKTIIDSQTLKEGMKYSQYQIMICLKSNTLPPDKVLFADKKAAALWNEILTYSAETQINVTISDNKIHIKK
ncbi:MAG: hypothetical protein V1709_07865 [Planctomycetota bacterium]